MAEPQKDENSLAVWNDFKTNQKALTKRLAVMIVNGRKLSDAEINALVAFSMTNDLNPFNGECYYLPGLGPTPGIAGWRKKAQEQLNWEAQQAQVAGAHYEVLYDKATPDEAKFDPAKGDIAWKVTIKDYISEKRWLKSLYEAIEVLKGTEIKNPYQEALNLVGARPQWTGIGVVMASESFGVDKMDRNERAKKRGEKLALRKRFPKIELPDVDYEPEDIIDVTPIPIENQNKIVAEEDILDDIEKSKKKEDPIQELRDQIIELGKTKGGAENPEVIKVFKKFDSKGNPNRIKDIEILKQFLNELSEVELIENNNSEEKEE